ncbi:hypothetical protein Scep_013180 [Stephania cephalantha]|uniref:Uncharacterized protein n=1 Tax=Stephania cephalantha TaxID=152367 RepID=A0AAP0JIT9_9MAGN
MRKSCLCKPLLTRMRIVNADTSKSVEFDKFSIVDEHLSEPEETLDVSSHEPDITIAQYDDDEAEKEIEVISKRSEEPQKENKEDQLSVWYNECLMSVDGTRPPPSFDRKKKKTTERARTGRGERDPAASQQHGGEIDGRPAVQQLRGAAVAIGDCAARGAATWQQRLREPAAARWTSSDPRRGACCGGGDCAKAAEGLLDGGGQRHVRTGRERGGGCAAGFRGGAAEQRWRASVATRRNAVRRLEGRQRRRRRGRGGAGEAAAVTRLRRRQRGGALSTGRMRDFDEIATTRGR